MVVEACDSIIKRNWMEYFSELLEEAFSVKEGGANKSIFTKEDVVSFESCIEVLSKEIKWFLFLPV